MVFSQERFDYVCSGILYFEFKIQHVFCIKYFKYFSKSIFLITKLLISTADADKITESVLYYAALLRRRGRILRRTLSVRLSVCPSVPSRYYLL